MTPSDWLPPTHEPDRRRLSPWRPLLLARVAVEELIYVVVDEIEGSAVGLSVSDWPRVDERPLRVGDAFAVRPRPGALEQARDELEQQRRLEPFFDPARWIKPPVYDITADAREAAKASFYAAVTPTLEPREATQLQGLEQHGPPPLTLHPGLLGRARDLLPTRLAAIVASAFLFALGIASGTAVGRASAPTTTVARKTITHSIETTIREPATTVTTPGQTSTATTTIRDLVTVTEAARTITETTTTGTTVTNNGSTVTETGTTVTETISQITTQPTTVSQTITQSRTVLQTITQSRTVLETITQPTTVRVTVPAPFTLRVRISDQGSVLSTPTGINCRNDGTVTTGRCTARFQRKTTVKLEAQPGPPCSFSGWKTSSTPTPCATNPCQITLTDTVTVLARFNCIA